MQMLTNFVQIVLYRISALVAAEIGLFSQIRLRLKFGPDFWIQPDIREKLQIRLRPDLKKLKNQIVANMLVISLHSTLALIKSVDQISTVL